MEILFLVFWVYLTVNTFFFNTFSSPPVITLAAEIASLQSAIIATRKEMQAQTKEQQQKTEKTQPEMKNE